MLQTVLNRDKRIQCFPPAECTKLQLSGNTLPLSLQTKGLALLTITHSQRGQAASPKHVCCPEDWELSSLFLTTQRPRPPWSLVLIRTKE